MTPAKLITKAEFVQIANEVSALSEQAGATCYVDLTRMIRKLRTF